MTLMQNALDGANGTAVTTAATSGDAVVMAGTTGVTAVYDTNYFADGPSSVKIGAVAAGQTKIVFLQTSESPQQAVIEGYFRLPALPTGTTGQVIRVGALSTSGTPVAAIDVKIPGTVQFSTVGGAAIGAASTSALALNKWYRFGLSAKLGAAGVSAVSCYVAEAFASGYLHSASGSPDLSTRTITGGQIGQLVAGAALPSGLWVDHPRFETGTTTFAGAFLAEPAAGTVNEGLTFLHDQMQSKAQSQDQKINASVAQLTTDGTNITVNYTDGRTPTVLALNTGGGTGGGTTSALTTADLDNTMGA